MEEKGLPIGVIIIIFVLAFIAYGNKNSTETDNAINSNNEIVSEETTNTSTKKVDLDVSENSDNNDTRPQKNGFDESTAKKVISGNYTIPVPDYFEENVLYKVFMDYRGYAETDGKSAMLDIYSDKDETDPATFEVLYDDRENMVKALKASLGTSGSCEFISYDIYETDELKGMIFEFSIFIKKYDLTGKCTWFVFPSEKDNKWINISLIYSDNTTYRYDEDFIKMINAIKKNDGSTDTTTTAVSKALSYSTNDKETAKKGNSGVFSYKNRGGEYYIYYIIDFDEGYVYRFITNDTSCDRLKIESGDLNNGLIVTYHDGDDTWSNGLHFKWQKQPEHLILEDNDHFESDFYSTDLNEALRIRDKKKIVDY